MSKIRNAARGQACQIRHEGCNGGPNNETVVFAHLPNGSMALKSSDLFGCFTCASCHDFLDGRKPSDYSTEQLLLLHLMGMRRTQEILLKMELITI